MACTTGDVWGVWAIDEDTGCGYIASAGPEPTAVATAKRKNKSARHVAGLRYEALPAGRIPAGVKRVLDLEPLP